MKHLLSGLRFGIFSLFSLIFIASCGGGGGDTPTVNTDTNLMLTNVSATALTSISVTFSENIDQTSLLSNGSQFILSDGSINAVSASVTDNVVIITTDSMAPCKQYTITVDLSVYATSGNLLNTSENTSQFTVLDPSSSCTQWLGAHNTLRQQLNSGLLSNSPSPEVPVDILQWDNNLEQVAQDHANLCVFEHNANRLAQYQALGGLETSVGENMALSMVAFDEQQFFDLWASEESVFVYEPIDGTNYSVFGHYTQLIWRNTTHIGCGRSGDCGSYYMAVCNYAPSGNFIGQYPY